MMDDAMASITAFGPRDDDEVVILWAAERIEALELAIAMLLSTTGYDVPDKWRYSNKRTLVGGNELAELKRLVTD